MSKVETLFEGQELSDAFKAKITSVFESIKQEANEEKDAVIEAKIKELEEKAELYIAEQKEFLETMTESYIEDEVMPSLNDYISEAVSKSILAKEALIAESAVVELSESFLTGIKDLMAKHNIEVPEGIDESKTKVKELSTKLNSTIQENVELSKVVKDLKQDKIIAAVSTNLTESQIEKLVVAAKKVSFISESDYESKVEDLKVSLGLVVEDQEPEPVKETQPITEQKTSSYLQYLVSQTIKK